MLRLNRVVEGLTLVLFGAMIVGNSMGVLPWRVWFVVVSLWPLLLIAIGIDIIGKGTRLGALRVLSSLLVMGGLLYAVLGVPIDGRPWSPRASGTGAFELSESDARGIDEASLTISIPAVELVVGEGEELIEASGDLPYGRPRLDVERSGGMADLELTGDWRRGPTWFGGSGAQAEVRLGAAPVWDLTFEAGVADADMDLSALTLSRLDVRTGVSKMDITLGEPGGEDRDVPVRVHTGVGDLTLRIPEGVEARVETSVGIGDVTVEPDIRRASEAKTWESRGYARARQRYLIVIDGGIGSVRVRRY